MSLESQLIDKVFLVKKQIRRGSFGEVYLAEDINTHKPVAVKTETTSTASP
jgi:serine/threonine protein kinase